MAVRAFVISLGPYRTQYDPPNGVVVLRGTASEIHPCAQWTPLAQDLFASGRTDAVFILDFSDLAANLPAELATSTLGPVMKPVQRCFMKVNPQDAVIVAAAATSALATKLVRNDLVSKAVKAAVYASPHPPNGRGTGPLPQTAHLLLGDKGAAQEARATFDGVFADVVYEIMPQKDKGTVMRSLAKAVQSFLPPPPTYEIPALPREEDALLCFSELKFSLDPDSRQMVQSVEDITRKVVV